MSSSVTTFTAQLFRSSATGDTACASQLADESMNTAESSSSVKRNHFYARLSTMRSPHYKRILSYLQIDEGRHLQRLWSPNSRWHSHL